MANLTKTSLGPKADRTAAHAAIRDLAESYGVDLLPLELSTDLTITPIKPQSSRTARRSCDISRSCSLQDELPSSSIKTGLPSIPAFPTDSIEQAGAVWSEHDTNTSHAPNPLEQPQPTAAVSASAADTVTVAGEADAAESSQLPDNVARAVVDDSEVPWVEDPAYLSESEYLQYQIPLDQQLLMLEEERDILVDKLLATTAALHASEARNRENQASASQVAALLNQLQELLRRAEVERDKAKLQLKRQRMSASQVPADSDAFAVVEQLAAEGPIPFAASQLQLLPSTAHNSDASSTPNQQANGTAPQQRQLKKHKSTSGTSSGSSSLPGPGQDSQLELGREQSPADAVVLGTGRTRSSSSTVGGSSSGSVEQLLQVGDEEDLSVPLMPSSNSVRPPVRSVIHGFEALMKQKAREAAAKAAAAAAARRFATDAAAAAAALSDGQLAVDLLAYAEGSSQLPAAAVDALVGAYDAAAAAAVPPPVLAVKRATSDESSNSSGPAVHQQIESSSMMSTPTAAAVYSASPTAFAAETETAAGGAATLEAALAASYAEVAKRNSSEWSNSSSRSRDGSRSPTKRAVRSPRKAALHSAAAAAGPGSSSPKFGRTEQHWGTSSSSSSSGQGSRVVEFGSSDCVNSSSSSLAPRAKSLGKGSHSGGSSTRLGPASADSRAGLPTSASQNTIGHQQQQHDPELCNPQHHSDYAGQAVAGAAAQEGIEAVHSKSRSQPRASIAASAGSSIDAAVQVVEHPDDCTAEVQAVANPAAPAVSSSNSHKGRSRSNSPKNTSQASKQQQQQPKQQQGKSRDTSSQEASTSCRAAVQPTSSSSSSWGFLRVLLIAVLLLLTGSMLPGLLTRSTGQQQPVAPDADDARVAGLQAQLSVMQQKVVVLERQLSEQSAACGSATHAAVDAEYSSKVDDHTEL